MVGIPLFLSNTDTVGIELEEGKALFLAQGDDFIQIITHGRLATGKLDVEGASPLHQQIILPADFLQRKIVRLLISCGSEAHRALQITAIGQFQQHTAAVPLMALAQTAVIGTALFHRLRPNRRHDSVGIAFCPGNVAFYVTFPDEGAEIAMIPAPFFHIDIAVVTNHLFRRNFSQADGADRHSFSDFHL